MDFGSTYSKIEILLEQDRCKEAEGMITQLLSQNPNDVTC